jgi:hypothetical protein
VLVGARSKCFKASDDSKGVVAAVHVEVKGGRVHTSSPNPSAECLAGAIEGVAIADTSDFSVDLQVAVGDEAAPSPKK